MGVVCGGQARRSGAAAVYAYRIQSFPRPERVSGGAAAVGDVERDRFEHGRVSLEGDAGRIRGADGAGRGADGNGKLWRAGGDGGRTRVYRREQGRAFPGVRSEDGARTVENEIAGGRLCDAGDV